MYNSDINNVTIIKENASAIGIQSGENIHHQDQPILPVSFKIKKTIKTMEDRPRPPDLLFSSGITFIFDIRNKVCIFVVSNQG